MKILIDMNLSPRWVKLFDDTGEILAVTHGEKPSVVQIRAENVSPDVIGRPVITALRQMTAELEEGALITVDPKRTRLRLLPFPMRE